MSKPDRIRVFLNRKKNFIEMRNALNSYDSRKKTVLYHHMNSFVLPPSWLITLSKEFNIHMVTSLVDLQECTYPDFLGSKIAEKRRENYKVTLDLAKAIVTASPFLVDDANKFLQIPQNKMFVAPLGWDHIPPIEKISATNIDDLVDVSKPFYIYPAKAWRHKGHTELIESFSDSEIDGALLLVGGLGKQRYALEKIIRKKQQQKRIKVLGFQSDLMHYSLIAKATGMLFPSVYEGFGLPYVESAILRTPVIAFEIASVNSILGSRGAFLFEGGDYGAMVGSLPSILNSSIKERVITNAFNQVVNLTWENTAKKTAIMYRSLVE